MADNVTLNASVGTFTAASDEVTRNAVTEQQQIVKISLGADGACDTLLDSGQQASAASVPVVIASDQSAVAVSAASLPLPTGAATEASLAGLSAKVTVCNTGSVAGTVTANLGTIGAAATESTLSTINGKITACNTNGVVVATSALPSGAATEASLSSLDGKVTACNTGAVVVSSGAVTATLSAETTKVIGTVNVAAGQTIATTNAGTFAVQPAGSVADDGTSPPNPVMIGGKAVETDGTDPGSVSAEDDVAICRTDRNRRLLVNDRHPNSWSAFHDETSAQTDHEVKAAPGANLSLYITDIIISNGATAGTVKIIEDTGTAKTQIHGTIYVGVNSGYGKRLGTPIRVTANKNVGFTSTTVTTHSVTLLGYTAP